jgi:citronellol/citronellal dehydrogenase
MTVERLAGKVAVVTGASRGIGRVVALTLAREGASVVVAAKSRTSRETLPGSIHTVAEEIEAAGGKALPIRVDVRDDAEVETMAAAAEETFGGIDILVNNAGALWWQDVAQTPMKRFDLVMGVNVRAAFACTHACLPAMRRRGGGHVVVFSPPVDLEALPGKTAYLISKFGMTMLALGLAEELRDEQIAANALWPVTAIESLATINYKLGGPRTWRKPEIVADATLEIVTSPPETLTGRALLDEDFLRERGWTDFTPYRCDPDHEPPRLLARAIPRRGLVSDAGLASVEND